MLVTHASYAALRIYFVVCNTLRNTIQRFKFSRWVFRIFHSICKWISPKKTIVCMQANTFDSHNSNKKTLTAWDLHVIDLNSGCLQNGWITVASYSYANFCKLTDFYFVYSHEVASSHSCSIFVVQISYTIASNW